MSTLTHSLFLAMLFLPGFLLCGQNARINNVEVHYNLFTKYSTEIEKKIIALYKTENFPNPACNNL